MKLNILFISLSVFYFTPVAFSQPLNNSFENWTSGMLDQWFIDSPQAVSQVGVAHEGSSSAKLEVIDLGGFAFIPIMQSLTSTFGGHPVSERHGSLQGWYQSMPLGSDVLIVSVIMLEGSSNPVGSGAITIPGTISAWTQFTVPIFYVPGSPTPDNTIITIQMADTSGSGESGTIGSMAYVDYLTFTAPSNVEQISGLPGNYSLSQNYPNPFNPITNIEYSIPEQSLVKLIVYDVLGNEVAILVDEEQTAGTYRSDFTAENLASGLYFAQLKVGEYVQTIKMSLLK